MYVSGAYVGLILGRAAFFQRISHIRLLLFHLYILSGPSLYLSAQPHLHSTVFIPYLRAFLDTTVFFFSPHLPFIMSPQADILSPSTYMGHLTNGDPTKASAIYKPTHPGLFEVQFRDGEYNSCLVALRVRGKKGER